MARLSPKVLNLNDCERLELQQLINRHNTPQQIALRAKIVLLASEAKNHREIARTLNIGLDMARLWLNQIEIWFSILVRKLLKRASFKSQDDLKTRIIDFINYFNKTMAKPFKWTYKGKVLAI